MRWLRFVALSYSNFRLFESCLAANQSVVKKRTCTASDEGVQSPKRETNTRYNICSSQKTLQYPLALRYIEHNVESLCYLCICELELSIFRQSTSVPFSKKCPNINNLLYINTGLGDYVLMC